MPKPPRDTAQKWLAFGAMVVVAVGVSFASNAFKSHLQKGLPEAGTPEHTPLVSSPPPAKPLLVEPADPDDDVPEADDPPTVPPGNARSSLAALPPWARDTPPRYAPLHTDAVELMAAASETGNIARAVLVCRGERTSHEGDLQLRLNVGSLPQIVADGAKQSTSVYVTAPLVDLKDGTSIEAILSERRTSGLVDVVRMKKTSGEQLRSWENDGELDCAVLAGKDLQDRIAQDAGRADSALGRLSRLKIDPREVWDSDLKTEQPRAERRVKDLAALVGWDDPRVKTRVTSYNSALQRYDGERRYAFEDMARSAGRMTKVNTFSVNLERFACSLDACEMALEITNLDDVTRAWTSPDVTITFLKEAKVRPEAWTNAEIAPTVIPTKERMKVLVRGPKGLQDGRSIVQLCVPRLSATSCGVLHLH